MFELKNTEIAVLGGGCFWCLQAIYDRLDGVMRTQCGYAGGNIPYPTYEQICTGNTGHAEVVFIEFDSKRISFTSLLRVFFSIHDPTTVNRQGHDVGTQYRSVIFAQSEVQFLIARAEIRSLSQAHVYEHPIVTEVLSAMTFWSAEGIHENYFERFPDQRYCSLVIQPKMKDFERKFADLLRPSAV